MPAGKLRFHINTWKVIKRDPWVLYRYHKGLSDRLPIRTTAKCSTSLSTVLCRADPINSGGGQRTSRQRSHKGSSQPLGRVLLKPVSCPKEGWRTETGNKPKSSEQVCSNGAFQNGGNPYINRPSQSGGLVGKSGSERCILRNPDPPMPPPVLEVRVPGKTLSDSVPTLRPVIGTLGLYQDPKASTSPPPRDGGTTDSIHRLYPCPGGVQGTSKESCRGFSVPPAMSGFKGKPEEINFRTSPSNRIPGLHCRHSPNGAETPSGQDKKICAESRAMMREKKQVSGRALVCLVGKMSATSQVIPPDPLFYRHLQMALSATLNQHHQCYEALVPLTTECREELMWWDTHMINWNGKSLLKKEVDMIIDSDASLTGWGATSQNQRTGGPWSQTEHRMHINCLELLAATLAVQTFLKNKTRMSVLLRLDSTTAVAYINNLGGTVSKELVDVAKNLWMWCRERNIHITAQHLPGVQNVIADAESRTMTDRSDWQLKPVIFGRITRLWGLIEMDLFASRLTAQCPAFFSWQPYPYAVARDAFLQDWSQIKGYPNPPWSLFGRVLSKVQMDRARTILVAPVWKTQPWYPLLLQMLIAVPRLINHDQIMLNRDPEGLVPQLAWHISGRDTETKSFRRKLPHSCSSHGGLRQTSLMTHSLASGIAGVVQGVQISLQAL